jgi:hypothetical protein
MVLRLNMFKATSPATGSLRVGRFFNHLSCSNDRDKARGQPPSAKRRRGYHPSPSLTCWNLGLALIGLCVLSFVILSFVRFIHIIPSPLGERAGSIRLATEVRG